jgi:hypothetical protein
MHGPLNVKLNQQIAPSENRTHYYMFRPLSLAIFREYKYLKAYTALLYR